METTCEAYRLRVNLRNFRVRAGLTQRQLAAAVGVGQSDVSKFERGAARPGWPVIVRISAALGVSVAAFTEPPKEG